MNPTSTTRNSEQSFWNVVDNVTIGLNQSTDTKVVSTTGVNFFLSFEHWVARQKT